MMNRCGHTEPELSCPICTSRDDLIARIDELENAFDECLVQQQEFAAENEQLKRTVNELRAVIKRLADDEPIGWEPGGLWTGSEELQVRIALAKIHATEE